MKKLMMVCTLAVTVVALGATKKKGPVGEDGGETVAQGNDAKVLISNVTPPGGMCLAAAPSLQAQGRFLGPVSGKARQWIVLEAKYDTYAKWLDELTFQWHILLDSSKGRYKDPKKPVSRYSYYTTSVTYEQIRKGTHMASVCLPPSVYDRFGEPCSITVFVTNKEGDELAINTQSTWGDLPKDKWWMNDKLMTAHDRKLDLPLVERRQGLLERGKTPFALVNSGDLEMVRGQ